MTWKDLKRALKAAFLPYYSHDLYMRLQKLTQGSQCVKEYTTPLYNFLSSNELHECPPWLVFQYIEGLRQDIKDELCGHSFDTVGQVAGEAEAAEKRLFNKKPKHETSPAIKNTNPPLLITPVSNHVIQPSTFKNLQRSLRCSTSGKQGHLRFECPTSHVQLPTHAGSSDQTEMDKSFGRPIFNVFTAYCIIRGFRAKMMVGGAACENVIAQPTVDRLKLPTEALPSPYYLAGLSNADYLKVLRPCRVAFSINS